jgi:hypothetical protein
MHQAVDSLADGSQLWLITPGPPSTLAHHEWCPGLWFMEAAAGAASPACVADLSHNSCGRFLAKCRKDVFANVSAEGYCG